MSYTTKPDNQDWERLRSLEDEVQRTGKLVPTDERRELLRRVASQTSITFEDAERMLEQANGGADLVLETRRRIREGSRRLSRAIVLASKSVQAGRIDEARAALREIIDHEQVPFYREIATVELRRVEDGDDKE